MVASFASSSAFSLPAIPMCALTFIISTSFEVWSAFKFFIVSLTCFEFVVPAVSLLRVVSESVKILILCPETLRL